MSSVLRPGIALLTLLLAIAFAVSPFLVADFNGFDPDQFPIPQEDPPVQPEGYAFAIWGPIYLWLVIGMAWGLVRAPRDGQWHDMRLPLCASLAVGAVWLAVAVTSPVWASVLIWVMLLTALAALFMAPNYDIGWAAWPVGFYAGWLSAASCVSLGLLAAGYGYMDGVSAGLVFVSVAIVLAVFVQSALRRAPTYGAAVIWALAAVAVHNWGVTTSVAYLALGGAVLMLWPTWRAFQLE